ncbi:MAG: class I SAM-dependent methyltransferase [Oscillospiraceae bacterium]|nr:class I SAM-dependent methyltransferase [Oscillospiraceae bacterium]
MTADTAREEEILIDFWSKALAPSPEDQAAETLPGLGDWKELAPAEKLFRAAASLGQRKKVLDYGCGSAWAGIIAAKSGCPDVTAVDPASGAAEAARVHAALFGAEDRLKAVSIPKDWLSAVPDGTYDGFFCSNVLDVIPPERAETILRESARICTRDAAVIIGLNFHLTPEAAAQRSMELKDGNRLYVDGVLRLVSRSDEEWADLFSPWYTVERLEHFAWPGEKTETRRLFTLRKREDA